MLLNPDHSLWFTEAVRISLRISVQIWIWFWMAENFRVKSWQFKHSKIWMFRGLDVSNVQVEWFNEHVRKLDIFSEVFVLCNVYYPMCSFRGSTAMICILMFRTKAEPPNSLKTQNAARIGQRTCSLQDMPLQDMPPTDNWTSSNRSRLPDGNRLHRWITGLFTE